MARSAVRKENDSAYNGSRVHKDDAPLKSVFPDGRFQTLSYDSLRRNDKRIYYPVKNAAVSKRMYTEAEFVAGLNSASSRKGSTALIGKKNKSGEQVEQKGTEKADKGLEKKDNYYKKGRPKGGNPKEDKLLRKDTAKIKSEGLKKFLESIGETVSKWKKIMETWETPEGDIYERHYWTDGTNSYYYD